MPEVGKVYVVGNVKMPGAFPVQDPSGTSILKVLALTQGLAPYATNEAYIISIGGKPALPRKTKSPST